MTASPLMVVGTGSGVGKSSLVAGLGRLLERRGHEVSPFKAQNMSNNSHIARDGGEIAVSQFTQARACRTEPTVNMNPILLKPNGKGESEVVVQGTPRGVMSWDEYRERFDEMRRYVMESYREVARKSDFVLLEGAGSPAEPNLADKDLVNVSLAEDLNAPVVLVGDISHGGVFAWLLGTMKMLEPARRRLVKGIVINKFRGDKSVLDEAVTDLEDRLGIPVLGIVPFCQKARLPAEDSRDLSNLESRARREPSIDVTMVRFPNLSNFTDFETLADHPSVSFRVLNSSDPPSSPDVVILPGTKNTLRDLRWLKDQGLDQWLESVRESGTEVLGVCGGYQMMGTAVEDPEGIESELGKERGLGWFDFSVRYETPKLTRRIKGSTVRSDVSFRGYEVRYGRFVGARSEPWATNGESVLARTSGNVLGTSVHGFLRNEGVCRDYLKRVSGSLPVNVERSSSVYDRWADVLEEHLRVERFVELADNDLVRSGRVHAP